MLLGGEHASGAQQDTTMEGAGHCGCSLCLDAPSPDLKSSMKSMSAKRHIKMLASVAWHLKNKHQVQCMAFCHSKT